MKKKSLIALAAVLGSMAAGGVAQAQSSVTLYGVVDAYVGSSKTGLAAPSVTVLDSGAATPSRWGLSGVEDLGGGLKVIFQLEQGLDVSTGTAAPATAFSHQAYVGLSGGFGTLTVGKVWTTMDDVMPAHGGLTGDSILPAATGVLAVQSLYAVNPGNSIKYVSPSFGGFDFAASYSLDEAAAVKQDIADFRVSYGDGPIAANLAYQVQNDVLAPDDLKLTYLNGSYDFGMAKLLASYGQAKLGAAKAKDYMLGVDFPLSSALTLTASYARSKDNAAAGGDKRTGYGLTATYDLSKRTTTYLGFRQSSTKDAAGVKVDKDRLLALGIRHRF